MPECCICYKNKQLCEIDCSHSFCHQCIQKWYKENKGKGCPICRQPYTLQKYNTRYRDYKNNKKTYIQQLKQYIKEYNSLQNIDEQLPLWNQILSYIYEHKYILKCNPGFNKVIKGRINHLKEKQCFIGYYWDNKLYSL
jgi:hypothetical protein